MFSRFFINRPVFASVISIVIVLAGLITLFLLPVEQYPNITPPTVEVSTNYPGADAKVVADTVATPIEQEVNGVENMIYMSSASTSDGKMVLTVTFEVGTDLDMAQVLVQNRVAIAEPRLPEEVKRQGITTKKKSTSMTLALCLYSPDGDFDELYLSNYATQKIKDELARVAGVGEVAVFGTAQYGMRIWLDPNLLAARDLTTTDVLNAIREQNVQVAAGQIGQPPTPAGQNFQYTVTTTGRLTDEEQFQDIIIKTGADGQIVRLKDIARIELGAENYNWFSQLNGAPSATLMIYQLPGANAIEVADKVREAMGRLSQDFPPGLKCDVVYDFTDFVKASIKEVVETLFVAIVLVILSVYIFLQDLRTTMIPALTIPVALIGTLAAMMALGFSINTLSLFGLVLVIGIVVDDAIVVVENTVRLIEDEGLNSKAATAKAMEEVTGPVIATTLVLLAVFLPTAFFPGITGQLYRQFALTISVATLFSSLNALTLSPAMCALLLRPSMVWFERTMMFVLKLAGPAAIGLWLDTKFSFGIENLFFMAGVVLGILLAIGHLFAKRGTGPGWFFRGFNVGFDISTAGYMGVVKGLVRQLFLVAVLFVGLLVATAFGFMTLPTGFMPNEDQGYYMVNIQLPDAASRERTDEIVRRVEKICEQQEGHKDAITFTGYSLLDANVSSNMGSLLVTLKPWDDRTTAQTHVNHIVATLNKEFAGIQEAIVFAFPPPPIQGIGMAGGFDMRLQDRGDVGQSVLQEIANDVVASANANPVISDTTTRVRADVPQIFIKVDRTKVKKHDVPLQEVFDALQANLGSVYVNDFNKFGRIYKVMIQADHQYRDKVEDISLLKVRNREGRMIPLTSVVTVVDSVGPQKIDHYNIYASATINGNPAPGASSGQAVAAMRQICDYSLPQSMGYEWTGMTFQEIKAGGLAPFIFSLAIIFAYLFLTAQYESFTIPLGVIFSVPLAILGALIGVWLRGMDINVYTQIGLVLLIALASKNAILIVEFAKQQSEQGKSPVDAAIEAARLRFRPILMTAFSFILGIIPLVIASGAGAESRKALGTAVFGGMLAATFFGVFMVPALYAMIRIITDSFGGGPQPVGAGPTGDMPLSSGTVSPPVGDSSSDDVPPGGTVSTTDAPTTENESNTIASIAPNVALGVQATVEEKAIPPDEPSEGEATYQEAIYDQTPYDEPTYDQSTYDGSYFEPPPVDSPPIDSPPVDSPPEEPLMQTAGEPVADQTADRTANEEPVAEEEEEAVQGEQQPSASDDDETAAEQPAEEPVAEKTSDEAVEEEVEEEEEEEEEAVEEVEEPSESDSVEEASDEKGVSEPREPDPGTEPPPSQYGYGQPAEQQSTYYGPYYQPPSEQPPYQQPAEESKEPESDDRDEEEPQSPYSY